VKAAMEVYPDMLLRERKEVRFLVSMPGPNLVYKTPGEGKLFAVRRCCRKMRNAKWKGVQESLENTGQNR
jgi:hypothetical protein